MINSVTMSDDELTKYVNTKKEELKAKRVEIKKLEADTYDIMDDIEEVSQILLMREKNKNTTKKGI